MEIITQAICKLKHTRYIYIKIYLLYTSLVIYYVQQPYKKYLKCTTYLIRTFRTTEHRVHNVKHKRLHRQMTDVSMLT